MENGLLVFNPLLSIFHAKRLFLSALCLGKHLGCGSDETQVIA
jgi:hypothetical protein